MSSGGSNDPPLPPDKLNELRYDDLESEASLAVKKSFFALHTSSQTRVKNIFRKAVKEQLKTLGVNDQIKSLVAEKRNYKPTKGKEPGITKEQAIEELKVLHWPLSSCNNWFCLGQANELLTVLQLLLCRAEG